MKIKNMHSVALKADRKGIQIEDDIRDLDLDAAINLMQNLNYCIKQAKGGPDALKEAGGLDAQDAK